MKTRFIIPLLVLTSCASHPPQRVVRMAPTVPGTTLSSETVGTVRYPENVKAYPVGRYIDPNDGFVMHEGHTIYRVETTAKWNLHPDGTPIVRMGPPLGIIDTAHRQAPINAEIIAEVNKQKAATQALLDEHAKFDRSLSQLPVAIQATKELGQQNVQLHEQLDANQRRIEALEAQLRKKQADGLFGANENTKTNEW